MSFTVAVLAACLALKWAADLLRQALPILIPTAVVVVLTVAGWRWWRSRSQSW